MSSELSALENDGFVVLPSVLSAAEIAAIRDALAPHLATTPHGRNRFEGLRSQRVYALCAKSPAFADLVSHPRILELLDHLLEPNYLLSSALAINNGPGEDRQQIHFDDSFYRSLARPRRSVSITSIWAIDEFTDTNGATEILPGSHRWARQGENMTLAVPQDIAAGYSLRVQELLGYSLHVPFMGHVNGLHPLRLIDPDYGTREREDAVRAATYLEHPR